MDDLAQSQTLRHISIQPASSHSDVLLHMTNPNTDALHYPVLHNIIHHPESVHKLWYVDLSDVYWWFGRWQDIAPLLPRLSGLSIVCPNQDEQRLYVFDENPHLFQTLRKLGVGGLFPENSQIQFVSKFLETCVQLEHISLSFSGGNYHLDPSWECFTKVFASHTHLRRVSVTVEQHASDFPIGILKAIGQCKGLQRLQLVSFSDSFAQSQSSNIVKFLSQSTNLERFDLVINFPTTTSDRTKPFFFPMKLIDAIRKGCPKLRHLSIEGFKDCPYALGLTDALWELFKHHAHLVYIKLSSALLCPASVKSLIPILNYGVCPRVLVLSPVS
jgi:hypothetical protein